MTVFGSFISLKLDEKRLILQTFFLNYYIRLILWIYSFQRVQKIAKNKGKHSKHDSISVSRLMWAVNASSHYVFRSTCLTKALTAQILLEQYGYESTLKVGVFRDEEFEAHAWVEHEGEVVMGASEKEYVPILDIE